MIRRAGPNGNMGHIREIRRTPDEGPTTAELPNVSAERPFSDASPTRISSSVHDRV